MDKQKIVRVLYKLYKNFYIKNNLDIASNIFFKKFPTVNVLLKNSFEESNFILFFENLKEKTIVENFKNYIKNNNKSFNIWNYFCKSIKEEIKNKTTSFIIFEVKSKINKQIIYLKFEFYYFWVLNNYDILVHLVKKNTYIKHHFEIDKSLNKKEIEIKKDLFLDILNNAYYSSILDIKNYWKNILNKYNKFKWLNKEEVKEYQDFLKFQNKDNKLYINDFNTLLNFDYRYFNLFFHLSLEKFYNKKSKKFDSKTFIMTDKSYEISLLSPDTYFDKNSLKTYYFFEIKDIKNKNIFYFSISWKRIENKTKRIFFNYSDFNVCKIVNKEKNTEFLDL